jgi:glycosyltransferase involved in cell wall biosynthesis
MSFRGKTLITKPDNMIDAIIPIKNNSVIVSQICEVIEKAIKFKIKCIVILDCFSEEDVIKFNKALAKNKNSEMIMIKSGIYRSPGLARNAGIEISSSKWITFWDADDFPDPEAISIAVEKYGSEQIPIIGQFQINSIKTKTENISDVAINPGIWRIIFPKYKITTLRFSDRLWGEDQLFIVQSELLIDNIRIVPDYFYNYQTSINGQLTQNEQNVNDAAKSLTDIYKFNLNYRSGDKNLESQLIPVIKISATILKRFIYLEDKLSSIWQLLKINLLSFLFFKKDYLSAMCKVVIKSKEKE